MIKVKNQDGVYVEPKVLWYKIGDTYEKVTKVFTNPQESTILNSQASKQKYIDALSNIRSKIKIQEDAIAGTGNEKYSNDIIDTFRDELPVLRIQENIFSTELIAVTQDTAIQNFVYNFQLQFEKAKSIIDRMIDITGGNLDNFTVIEVKTNGTTSVDPQTTMFYKISTRPNEKVGANVFTLNGKYYRIVDSTYTEEEKLELINKIKELLGPQMSNGVLKYSINQQDSLDTIITFLQNILYSIRILEENAEIIKERFYLNLKDTQVFNDELDKLHAIADGSDTTLTSSQQYLFTAINQQLNEELFVSNNKLKDTNLGLSKCLINDAKYSERKDIPDYNRFVLLKNWSETNPDFIVNAQASGDITETEVRIFTNQYNLEKSIIQKNNTLKTIRADYSELLAILLDQKELSLANKILEIQQVQQTAHEFWEAPIKAINETPNASSNNWVESYNGGGTYNFGPDEMFNLSTENVNLISWFESNVHSHELAVTLSGDPENIISIMDTTRTSSGLELILEAEHPNIITQEDSTSVQYNYGNGLNHTNNHPIINSQVEANRFIAPLQVNLSVNHPSQIVMFMNQRYTIPLETIFNFGSDYWKYSLMIRQIQKPKLKTSGLFNDAMENKNTEQEFIVSQTKYKLNTNDVFCSVVGVTETNDYIVSQSPLGLNGLNGLNTNDVFGSSLEHNILDNDFILTQTNVLGVVTSSVFNDGVESGLVNSINLPISEREQNTDYTTDELDSSKTYKSFVVYDLVDIPQDTPQNTLKHKIQEIRRHKIMRENQKALVVEVKSDELYLSVQEGLVIIEDTNLVSNVQTNREYLVNQTNTNPITTDDDSVFQKIRKTPITSVFGEEYIVNQTETNIITSNEYVSPQG